MDDPFFFLIVASWLPLHVSQDKRRLAAINQHLFHPSLNCYLTSWTKSYWKVRNKWKEFISDYQHLLWFTLSSQGTIMYRWIILFSIVEISSLWSCFSTSQGKGAYKRDNLLPVGIILKSRKLDIKGVSFSPLIITVGHANKRLFFQEFSITWHWWYLFVGYIPGILQK